MKIGGSEMPKQAFFSVFLPFRFQFLSEKEMLVLGKCLNNRVVMEEKSRSCFLIGFLRVKSA